MTSVQELAEWVIECFDPTKTTTVERICEEALRLHGIKPFAADTEANEKAARVLALLRAKEPENLPFEFSDTAPNRLIGKQRIRPGDSPETIAARKGLALLPDMAAAIYERGDCTFEKLCAAVMVLSGALEAFAGCASDDGGIDVYGRLPLRLTDERINAGILHTAILRRSLFFLGQCKCINTTSALGPEDIRQFYGAVEDCRAKYEHNAKPPSHRVPESYYQRGEVSISVFFTTGTFTSKAQAAAEADGVILITGRQIAQFLILHRVAVVAHGETLAVDAAALDKWADSTINASLVGAAGRGRKRNA